KIAVDGVWDRLSAQRPLRGARPGPPRTAGWGNSNGFDVAGYGNTVRPGITGCQVPLGAGFESRGLRTSLHWTRMSLSSLACRRVGHLCARVAPSLGTPIR